MKAIFLAVLSALAAASWAASADQALPENVKRMLKNPPPFPTAANLDGGLGTLGGHKIVSEGLGTYTPDKAGDAPATVVYEATLSNGRTIRRFYSEAQRAWLPQDAYCAPNGCSEGD